MSKNQDQQFPTFHFFLSVFAPWRFKKNVQMPFKLSSQNVSSFLVWEKNIWLFRCPSFCLRKGITTKATKSTKNVEKSKKKHGCHSNSVARTFHRFWYGKKHLVVPFFRLLSEARFYREGAKSAKGVEL